MVGDVPPLRHMPSGRTQRENLPLYLLLLSTYFLVIIHYH